MSKYLMRPSHAEEAEKPFWISYSDLMTALMILFLVIMVTSLTSVSQQRIAAENPKPALAPPPSPVAEVKPDPTPPVQKRVPIEDPKPVDPLQAEKEQRAHELARICQGIADQATVNDVKAYFDCRSHRIDFGEAGRFASGEYKLLPEGEEALRKLVPMIITSAQSEIGRKWLKRIHIQGYTDTDGSYLYNLNLSLKRSEWVMCKLLSTSDPQPMVTDDRHRHLIKQLFLAGGVAFNDLRQSKDASRRVELKFEYFSLDEVQQKQNERPEFVVSNAKERCQI